MSLTFFVKFVIFVQNETNQDILYNQPVHSIEDLICFHLQSRKFVESIDSFLHLNELSLWDALLMILNRLYE